jgi:hypothetical protein
LIAECVRNEHKVAWLIGAAGAAIACYLDIQGDTPHRAWHARRLLAPLKSTSQP